MRASGPPVRERVRDAEPVLPRHHGIRGPAQARRPARQARLHEFPGAAREGRGRRLTNPPSRWWTIVAIGSLLRDTVEAVRRLPHCRGPDPFSSWKRTTAGTATAACKARSMQLQIHQVETVIIKK